MPTFHFEAMDATGQEIRDVIDAENQEEAQATIRKNGLLRHQDRDQKKSQDRKEKPDEDCEDPQKRSLDRDRRCQQPSSSQPSRGSFRSCRMPASRFSAV